MKNNERDDRAVMRKHDAWVWLWASDRLRCCSVLVYLHSALVQHFVLLVLMRCAPRSFSNAPAILPHA